EVGGEKRFQAVQHLGVGGSGRNHLDQMHVARRVEEVHAAVTVTQIFRQRLGQGVDGQAGGVGGNDGVVGLVTGHLAVQVQLPVHAFGDGLDDQVALLECVEVFVVIGWNDGICQ